MQGRKAFEEKLFTNFQLSDRVPADNFYRRLKETVNLRFLYKTTSEYYGSEGQESIDPVVFFKLMLVEYRWKTWEVIGGSSPPLPCV